MSKAASREAMDIHKESYASHRPGQVRLPKPNTIVDGSVTLVSSSMADVGVDFFRKRVGLKSSGSG